MLYEAPVISITRHPFIAYTSNIMAVMGLRSLYFVLAHLLAKLRFLHYGLAAILGLFMVRGHATWRERVALGAMILAMGTQAYGNWLYRPTDVWLKPALCLVFVAWLVDAILRPRAARRLIEAFG